MAKEEIYTIPIIDAFKEDCECVLCHLYQKLEKESIDFVLGLSYMELYELHNLVRKYVKHKTNESYV